MRHSREPMPANVIHAEVLPSRPPDRTWGGPGTGALCALCGGTTARGEVELELVFENHDGNQEKTFHVHQRCFSSPHVRRPTAASDRVPGDGA